jgi:hypothetical protein
MTKSKWQLEPALTIDGQPFWQLCYYCGKQINFIKDSKSKWKRVGGIDSKLVRHTKCYDPKPLK